MRIMAVSDTPIRAYRERLDGDYWRKAGVDLLVSCGDLPAEYLDFLVDVLGVPLYYVRGNHDDEWPSPPVGENLDGRIAQFKGVKFLGIEGSPWYNGQGVQIGERAMEWKLQRLRPALWLAGRIDVVVAHAAPRFCPGAYTLCTRPGGSGLPCPIRRDPASGEPVACQDAADYAHRGFASYRNLILKHKPRLFLHGHLHQGFGLVKRERRIGETRVIDANGHVILDL